LAAPPSNSAPKVNTGVVKLLKSLSTYDPNKMTPANPSFKVA